MPLQSNNEETSFTVQLFLWWRRMDVKTLRRI